MIAYYMNDSGFSIIEMAVFTMVVGIIITVAATIMPSLTQTEKVKNVRDSLDMHQYAVAGYAASQKRFPCPDTDADGIENRNANGTPADYSDDTCAAYAGDVPHLTLGLASANDSWGNPVRLGVHASLISASSNRLLCTGLKAIRTGPFDSSKLYVSDLAGSFVNQAHVVVSGGVKDMDNVNGYFDGENGGADIRFESPDKVADAGYDDFVRAGSGTSFWNKLCAGGGGSGENSAANRCDNAADDDADGYVDCTDQDCTGIGVCP